MGILSHIKKENKRVLSKYVYKLIIASSVLILQLFLPVIAKDFTTICGTINHYL